jgi:hypothetical protein
MLAALQIYSLLSFGDSASTSAFCPCRVSKLRLVVEEKRVFVNSAILINRTCFHKHQHTNFTRTREEDGD